MLCPLQAGVAFLNVAATEFVELFVGRGAARVRQERRHNAIVGFSLRKRGRLWNMTVEMVWMIQPRT